MTLNWRGQSYSTEDLYSQFFLCITTTMQYVYRGISVGAIIVAGSDVTETQNIIMVMDILTEAVQRNLSGYVDERAITSLLSQGAIDDARNFLSKAYEQEWESIQKYGSALENQAQLNKAYAYAQMMVVFSI